MYIYIYISRERDRERDMAACQSLSVSLFYSVVLGCSLCHRTAPEWRQPWCQLANCGMCNTRSYSEGVSWVFMETRAEGTGECTIQIAARGHCSEAQGSRCIGCLEAQGSRCIGLIPLNPKP